MKLLYSRIGKTYSPVSGEIVKKHEAEDVVEAALSYPDGTRLMILTEVLPSENKTVKEELKSLMQQGLPFRLGRTLHLVIRGWKRLLTPSCQAADVTIDFAKDLRT
jgi:excinuclease UvrABC ATPase subunit